ncbi:hypothetical protein LOD99_7654 [Oopsacas minuta]|uniref:Mediator of RNA polymerase II transcription subunit 16 central helical bridge domain-containing protein n=1 Tax=Oopsacas minuta TaxID=111878 RepID=A0AAV7JQ53_9METZ|nr:hypothetical protein LOD99_7654 [Oopsacas minuta]
MIKDPSRIITTTILQKNVIYRLLQPIQPATQPASPVLAQQLLTTPVIAWHSSNIIAFSAPVPHDVTLPSHSIPNNSCDIFLFSPQAPWDFMQVNIPAQSGQVIDMFWDRYGSLFVLCQDGNLLCGLMEQHVVNKWSWERLKGLCFKDQLVLLQVVKLNLDDCLEGTLVGLTQTGEITVSKKMEGVVSSDTKYNLQSLSNYISAITDVTDFLDSGWTTLRGRIDVSQGPPITAVLGRSDSCGFCLYSLTERGLLSLYHLTGSFSPSESNRHISINHLLSHQLMIRGNILKMFLIDPLLTPEILICSASNGCLEINNFRISSSEGEQTSVTTTPTRVPLPSLQPLLFSRSFYLVPSVSQRDTYPSLMYLSPVGELHAVHSSTGELLMSRKLPHTSASTTKEEHKTPGVKYQKIDLQSGWPVLSISPNSCLSVILDLSSLNIHIINLGLNTPPDSSISGPSLMAQRFWYCLLADRSHWDLAICTGIRGDKDILPLTSELEARFHAESSEFREIYRPRFLSLKATLLSTLIDSYQQVCSLHNQIRLLITGQYLRTLLGPNSHACPSENWPSHQLRKQLESSQEPDLNVVIEKFETKEFTCAGGMNVKNELAFIVDQALLALNEVVGPIASLVNFPPHEFYIWRELQELLVLVGIWSKLYPRLSPVATKPESQDLLPHLFIAISRVLQSLQPSRSLVPAEILDGLMLPLNEPVIFTTSSAPPLQTLTWGISAEELPQLYYQARSPSISQNILPYLNILDPISLLLLEVPRQLSPPWIGEIPSSQYDVINHIKLEQKHWEEGLLQCTNCRKLTQCLDNNQGPSEEVVLLKQSWNRSCFCGGLWRRVDLSCIDILRFECMFANYN